MNIPGCTIHPEMMQQSEEWFKARAGRITASCASQIMTPNGKKSDGLDTLIYHLCFQSKFKNHIPSFTGNRHTDRGNENEPLAREAFSKIMGLEVVTVGFVTNTERYGDVVGLSPDGLVIKDGEIIAGLEAKCPDGPKHLMHVEKGKLPEDHIPQVHFSMAATGLPWYFVSFYEGIEPLIVPVERTSYTDNMSKAIDEAVIYYQERRKQLMPFLTGKGAA